MEDKVAGSSSKPYEDVKYLLDFNNDMGFAFGGMLDEILEELEEDFESTVETLDEECFFLNNDTVISMIENEMFNTNAESTINGISEAAASLKEKMLSALSRINETVNVSKTIKDVEDMFSEDLKVQIYANLVGEAYWEMLYNLDHRTDFDVFTNSSYTIGCLENDSYPDSLYTIHAELNRQKYKDSEIWAVFYPNEILFDVVNMDKKPEIYSIGNAGYIDYDNTKPVSETAKIVTDKFIDVLNEHKEEIFAFLKNEKNKDHSNLKD